MVRLCDVVAEISRPLHRFPQAPACVRALGLAPEHAILSLLTARHIATATERWTYDAQEADDEGRALAREAARRYKTATYLEAAFAVLLGAEVEIETNGRAPAHSVATVDFVSDMLDRALSDEDTNKTWGKRWSVIVHRLRLTTAASSDDVTHFTPVLSPVPLPFVALDKILMEETKAREEIGKASPSTAPVTPAPVSSAAPAASNEEKFRPVAPATQTVVEADEDDQVNVVDAPASCGTGSPPTLREEQANKEDVPTVPVVPSETRSLVKAVDVIGPAALMVVAALPAAIVTARVSPTAVPAPAAPMVATPPTAIVTARVPPAAVPAAKVPGSELVEEGRIRDKQDAVAVDAVEAAGPVQAILDDAPVVGDKRARDEGAKEGARRLRRALEVPVAVVESEGAARRVPLAMAQEP